MALQKVIPSSFDVNATYWNIGEEHRDYRTNTNRVVLHGYKDGAARAKKAFPLTSATVQIADNGNSNMSRADIYDYVKAQIPEFAGSGDV